MGCDIQSFASTYVQTKLHLYDRKEMILTSDINNNLYMIFYYGRNKIRGSTHYPYRYIKNRRGSLWIKGWASRFINYKHLFVSFV